MEKFNSGDFADEHSLDLYKIVKKFDKSKKTRDNPPDKISETKMIQSQIDEKKKKDRDRQKEMEERIEALRALSLQRAREAEEEDSEERSPMDEWERSVGIKTPKSLKKVKAGKSEESGESEES